MSWNIIKLQCPLSGIGWRSNTLCIPFPQAKDAASPLHIDAFFVEYKMFFYLHPLYFSREYDWKQPVL